MKLFETDWGVDNSPNDNTEITTTILYYSTDELNIFKSLCKKGIRIEFGDDYQEKGNFSDLILIILKEKYENL